EGAGAGGGGATHSSRRRPRPLPAGEPLARRIYHRAIAAATATSLERMRRNVTVVNSDWTGAAVRARHGLDSVTIRPPAAGPLVEVPWAQRAVGFVCAGRFSREKRFELVVDILAGVRARGHAVRLTIVGSPARAD